MTQRVTPKLDYEPPHRAQKPAPRKPEKFWSPKNWKLYLFAGWLACFAFWMPVAYERSHMEFVADTYSLYWHYEKQVQGGHNRDYARRGYKKAEARLREADEFIFQFMVTGFVWPLMILAAGGWLLRKAK